MTFMEPANYRAKFGQKNLLSQKHYGQTVYPYFHNFQIQRSQHLRQQQFFDPFLYKHSHQGQKLQARNQANNIALIKEENISQFQDPVKQPYRKAQIKIEYQSSMSDYLSSQEMRNYKNSISRQKNQKGKQSAIDKKRAHRKKIDKMIISGKATPQMLLSCVNKFHKGEQKYKKIFSESAKVKASQNIKIESMKQQES